MKYIKKSFGDKLSRFRSEVLEFTSLATGSPLQGKAKRNKKKKRKVELSRKEKRKLEKTLKSAKKLAFAKKEKVIVKILNLNILQTCH